MRGGAHPIDPGDTARRASSPEVATVLVVLASLLCVAYGNVVFGGRSLIYTNARNPLDARVMPENYGPDPVPESVWSSRNLLPYSNFHDPHTAWWQWEPAGEFLRHGLLRGEFPLWDPYVGAGAPALANLTATAFFPPYLAVLLLGGGPLLKNLYFLSLLLVAGTASYLFLRRHGLAREACLASAIAVIFCGALSQNVGGFIGQTVALLPVSLLVTRWFLECATWRRSACLAVAYAVIALSSFPPLLVAAFGLSGLYAASFAVACLDRTRILLRYGLAVAASVALVCFLYFPAVAASTSPQVEQIYARAGLETIDWRGLGQLLSPVLAGGRKVLLDPPVLGPAPGVPYVGVVTLLLALLATPPQRRDAGLLGGFTAAAALVITLKLMGVLPVQAIGYLPVLHQIHFAHYFGIPLNLLLCFLAGFGVDGLIRGGSSPRRLALASGVLALTTAYLFFLFYRLGKQEHPFAEQWLNRWCWLAGMLVAAALLVALCGRGAESTPRRRTAIVGLVGLLALEAMLNTYLPRQRRWDVWRYPAPYVQELIRYRDLGRVYGSGAFNANAGSAFDVYSLDSLMAFNSPRVFEFYRRYAAPNNSSLFLREAILLPVDPVLDAANIGLVAIYELRKGQIAEARARGYQSLWTDGHVHLFARRTSPRYYFTSQYRVLPPTASLEDLDEVRPPREILVEETPPYPSGANSDGDPVVEARVGRNRVNLSLDTPRPGLVYCSEAHAPGWRAWVNGKPARILHANHAFRAVPVPAGKVSIELAYWPPGLTAGLLASFCGLIGIAAMASRRESTAAASLELRPALADRWRRRAVWASVVVLAPLVGLEAERRYALADLRPSAGQTPDPTRPRSDAFYRVEWGSVELPSPLRAGETVNLKVPLRNLAGEAWPDRTAADPAHSSGRGAVRLSYRWLSGDDGLPLAPYSVRIDLPAQLPPGESIALPISVQLPTEPGSYRLQFDLVHELVVWFEARGATSLVIPVQIEVGP